MDHDATLDTIGLLCPLPVLKLRKRLQPLAPGQTVRVVADDPVAVIDIPAFCAEAGHALLSADTDPGGDGGGAVQTYVIRKGG